jgi:hypothetical protein
MLCFAVAGYDNMSLPSYIRAAGSCGFDKHDIVAQGSMERPTRPAEADNVIDVQRAGNVHNDGAVAHKLADHGARRGHRPCFLLSAQRFCVGRMRPSSEGRLILHLERISRDKSVVI